MPSAASPVWKAVDTLLMADSELDAVLAGDKAYADGEQPNDAPLPFLVYGASGEGVTRTFGGAGNDGTLAIGVRAHDKGEALTIAGRVIELLDGEPLAITGHDLTEGTCSLLRDYGDPSGSYNAALQYRALTEAVA